MCVSPRALLKNSLPCELQAASHSMLEFHILMETCCWSTRLAFAVYAIQGISPLTAARGCQSRRYKASMASRPSSSSPRVSLPAPKGKM